MGKSLEGWRREHEVVSGGRESRGESTKQDLNTFYIIHELRSITQLSKSSAPEAFAPPDAHLGHRTRTGSLVAVSETRFQIYS